MKRQIILDEYEFSDGDLRVIFTFDEKEYIEDFIDENSFEEMGILNHTTLKITL